MKDHKNSTSIAGVVSVIERVNEIESFNKCLIYALPLAPPHIHTHTHIRARLNKRGEKLKSLLAAIFPLSFPPFPPFNPPSFRKNCELDRRTAQHTIPHAKKAIISVLLIFVFFFHAPYEDGNAEAAAFSSGWVHTQ